MIYTNLILFIFIFVITCIISLVRWEKIVKYYNRKSSFLNFVFIIIYPFIEIVFLILYYFYYELQDLWVSIMLIIILLILSLDKLHLKNQNKIMLKSERIGESKLIRNFDKMLNKFKNEIIILKKENKDLIDYINSLK